MSVLKNKRHTAKSEHIQNANKIYNATLQFSLRLSTRVSRVLQPQLMNAASEIVALCMRGNAIYLNDEESYKRRKECWDAAIGAVRTLDMLLFHAYNLMIAHPQNAYDKKLSVEEATKRIDNMAENLGDMLDVQIKLLKSVRESDKNRASKPKQTKKTF